MRRNILKSFNIFENNIISAKVEKVAGKVYLTILLLTPQRKLLKEVTN
jgi:hypothetical protein